MNPTQRLQNFKLLVLAEYQTESFVIQQKAYVLFWVQLILIPVMLGLLLINLGRNNRQELFWMIALDLIFVFTLAAGLFLLKHGRYQQVVILNTMVGTTASIAGSLLKQPVMIATGFNSFTGMMFAMLVFTAMFGSRRWLATSTALFLGVNVGLYMITSRYIESPHVVYLDSWLLMTTLALVIVFCLSYLNGLITDQALTITQRELEKNVELNQTLEERVNLRTRQLQQQTESGERLIVELKDSLAKVKTLSGLLPICASCKKIRDDQGYWNQLEGYISARSGAEFSHGICPDCKSRLYGDIFKD
jgi:hypothetical protein